ncbi:tetratricopeptide repeat protein [Opitutus sp. ER46]|uniref:tetratricopeptide repeat protein n=1 Tax=Opitutus sp. ER46 TaxID=2161864 RepID=UPI001304C664|nr:tetratricopeptide repeat protein [Opitutus sp. ER46]
MTSATALRTAVQELGTAPQLEVVLALRGVREAVAAEFAKLDRRDVNSPAIPIVLEAIHGLAACGALDLPLRAKDERQLAHWQPLGWPGLVASMLVSAAWRWDAAPVFSHVPDWLWGAYAEWLFAAPNTLASDRECALYASHLSRHADELARWVQRHLGAPAVRAAVEAFARQAPLHPLRFARSHVLLPAELQGKILARLHGSFIGPFEPCVRPRAGRRLRVGFVARQWEANADTTAALAQFEHLPGDRFERRLFALQEATTAFGWRCRESADVFRVLPADCAGQAEMLRDAGLDVAVFVGDTTLADSFSRLASIRVAPLQAVENPAGITSGLPESDLCLVPAELAPPRTPSRHSERLGALPTTAFALRRGGDAERVCSRSDLGFPERTVLLVAVLGTTHGTLETLVNFGRILAQVPEAALVLQVVPDNELTPVGFERFCTIVCATLDELHVANDRVSVLAPREAQHEETRGIVRLADLFLTTSGSAVWAAEALAAGVPVVSADPVVSDWLKEARLGELTAHDGPAFVELAASLAADPGWRESVGRQLQRALHVGLACHDTLAASDGFAGVLETAFDQLEALGRSRFRRQPDAVRAGAAEDIASAVTAAQAVLENGGLQGAAEAAMRAVMIRPRDPKLRALCGRALLAEGDASRGVEYLLAAVQQRRHDANLWMTLANGLQEADRVVEALHALHASLRLDPGRPDAWSALVELATKLGEKDLAREACGALAETAPDHPQLAALCQCLGRGREPVNCGSDVGANRLEA